MPLSVHVRPWLSVAFFTLAFLAIIVMYCMMGYLTVYSRPTLLDTDIINVTSCRPQKYIVFIKVHKTGSTSVMNILQRYGLARNLTFILPLTNNYLGKHTTLHLSPRILVPPDNKAINILCNHVVYNRSAFRTALTGRKIVRERNQDEIEGSCNLNLITSGENSKDRRCGSQMDTNRSTIELSDYTLFTMIRRPLSQVLSTVYYYKLFPKVAAGDLMEAILKTPTFFTNNRVSFDLGLSPSHFHNPTKVREFITGIDNDFHLVLLMEYFDESMVLLRRRLCWRTPDILYIQRNTGENRPRIRVTSEQRERFRRQRAPADSALYDYFRPRFWRAVHAEGLDFFDEVHHYRTLLSLARDYCSYIEYQQFNPDPVRSAEFAGGGPNHTGRFGDTNESPLRIAASRWHSEFSIATEECDIMTMEELPLVDRIRQLKYGREIRAMKRRVHKTGSTSVMNILQRYGLARNLTFILPLTNNYLGKHTTLHLSPRILVPPDNKAINILCNHVVYNRSAFRTAITGRKIVRERNQDETEGSCNRNLITSGENSKDRRCGSQMDTNRSTIELSDYTLFTMIRRPLSQVLSTVYYYKLFPKVAAGDLMEAILKTPTFFTNNRVSFDLGLSSSHFHNPTKVREFITGIDNDFHLVLLMEYFDESMVLLRRRLCWRTPDILYIQRNTGENRPRIRVTSEQRERFRRQRAPADSALYDYFRPRFWRAVHAEGLDFFDEVHHYRTLLSLARDYCSYIEYQQFNPDPVRSAEFAGGGPNQTGRFGDTNESPLRIAASRWHSEFSIATEECDIMTMEELPLVDRIRQLKYGREIRAMKRQRGGRRVHKTGSTSVMNILQRYGLARNLTFIIPLTNNYLGKHTTLHLSPRILVPPDNKAINILCNHVVYNRSAFRTALTGRKIVRERNQDEIEGSCNLNLITSGENSKDRRCRSQMDTNRSTIDLSDYTLFTMIRRPLSQVLSTVYYYKLFPKVAAGDLMEAILKTPTFFTNNRVSFDLGLSPSHFHNPTKVREFITGIDNDFHLVLLMEYFDESMVLLRRRLCWRTPDILYIQRNTGENRPRIRVTSEQRERFRRQRAPADSALYDYFRPRFWRAVHAEGLDFFDEVHHYRTLLSLARDYCSYIEYQQFNPDPVRSAEFAGGGPNHTGSFGDTNESPLRIAASRWHSEFSIATEECDIMTMEELPLVDRIRQLKYGREIRAMKRQKGR